MTGRAADRLTAWSVRAYALVLHAYPPEFRREFGESMTQLFRDLARAACREPGVAGLAALWMRTAGDVLVSLPGAYARERRGPMFRLFAAAGILYVCALAFSAGYGALRYAEFYQPPAFSKYGAEAAGEEALVSAYQHAMAGEFGRYRTFALAAGLVVAVLLGAASALFGLWQRSLWSGAGAFAGGAVLTIAAVSLLPTVWFPLDRYPAGFVWLHSCFPIAAGTWLLIAAIGWLGPRFRTA
jgi:hypothetical protein